MPLPHFTGEKMETYQDQVTESVTALVTEDPRFNQSPNSQENALPNPGHLFHGLEIWQPTAALLTTQDYDYMP